MFEFFELAVQIISLSTGITRVYYLFHQPDASDKAVFQALIVQIYQILTSKKLKHI